MRLSTSNITWPLEIIDFGPSSQGAKTNEKRAIPINRDPLIENPPNLAPSPTTNRQTDSDHYHVHSTPLPRCPVDKNNPKRQNPTKIGETDKQTDIPPLFDNPHPQELRSPKIEPFQKLGIHWSKTPLAISTRLVTHVVTFLTYRGPIYLLQWDFRAHH